MNLSHPVVGNDFGKDNKEITALLDVLATLGENATKEVLAILKEQYKISLSGNEFSYSKQDVETALGGILGRGGGVVVMLWNEKLDENHP